MVRVLFFGTHPHQFNGYSKVLYEIVRRIQPESSSSSSSDETIEMGVFGFQNYVPDVLPADIIAHQKSRKLPETTFIHDAWSKETPKGIGFGLDQIGSVIESFKPDICLIYNDMLVIQRITSILKTLETRPSFRIVGYIDQVYKWPKQQLMVAMNEGLDEAIVFTEEWANTIRRQGLTLPIHVLTHGYDPSKTFPLPRAAARRYFGLSDADFVMLNLNRNQPRKRWDTCLKMMAELVHVFPNEPIKLVIATALTGAWDLLDIYHKELVKRNIPIDKGMRHIIVIDRPQRLTDREVNILMNAADIGINTCDGEGFGLCNFEHAICGKPQIVPRLGGFIDYLDDTNTIFVEPTMAIYNSSETRDGTGGEMYLSLYSDFVNAVETYIRNKKLCEAHGNSVRTSILRKPYTWNEVANHFKSIIKQVVENAKPKSIEIKIEEKNDEIEQTPKIKKKGKPRGIAVANAAKAAAKVEIDAKTDETESPHSEDDESCVINPTSTTSSKKRRKRTGGGHKRSTDNDLRMEIQELKDSIALLMSKK